MQKNAKPPIETMSAFKNRVYVLSKGDVLKSIIFYDKSGKRERQIDLDHAHWGVQPHIHPGYDALHQKSDKDIKLTKRDRRYINKVNRIWKEYKK